MTAGAPGGRASELLTMRDLPPEAPSTGITLRTLALTRDNGEWVPRPKSLNYLNALLGTQELQRRSSEATDEGLFLTRDGGFVVETSRQNIAWISNGHFCYPDPTLGAVHGTVLEWALTLGAPANACRATLKEFCEADAIVTLNAVRGITPVAEVRDVTDRVLLSRPRSVEHPMVVSLRRQWAESLAATARA